MQAWSHVVTTSSMSITTTWNGVIFNSLNGRNDCYHPKRCSPNGKFMRCGLQIFSPWTLNHRLLSESVVSAGKAGNVWIQDRAEMGRYSIKTYQVLRDVGFILSSFLYDPINKRLWVNPVSTNLKVWLASLRLMRA